MRAAVLAFVLLSALVRAETTQDAVSAEAPVVAESESPWEEAPAARPTSRHGQVGLLRTVAADFSRAGTLSLGAHTGFSRAAGLNIPGAWDTYATGLLALEWTPDGLPLFNRPDGRWGLALALSLGATADTNSATVPRTLYSVGDVRLDARVGARAGLVDVALDAFLSVPSRVDAVGPEGRALAPGLLLALTLPLERLAPSLPGRLHLNAGWQHSNSRALLEGYAGSVAAYTFGASRFDAVPLAAGLEWPLALGRAGRLVPFVEYSREQPLGVSAGGAVPQRVTPGLRYVPVPGLALDAAVEVGLTGGRVEGLAPVPPWLATLGVSYALGQRTVTVYRERVVEVAPSTGQVRGTVTAKSSGAPVPHAVVGFGPGVPPTVTDAQGRFTSPPLPPGPHAVTLTREGYEDAHATVTVPPRQETEVALALAPLPKKEERGTLRGRVVDLNDNPVPVMVELSSPSGGAPQQHRFEDGTYELTLSAGRYHLVVGADGHLSQGYAFEVADGDRIIRDFVLRPVPRRPVANLTPEKIEIKSQLHFAFNKSRLLEPSFPILDEVASILLSHPRLKRVRIEGHTDDIGDLAYNQRLSEARANAVLDYLLSKGVELDRLVTVGYGKTRPLKASRSSTARALNRRVEFVILEQ